MTCPRPQSWTEAELVWKPKQSRALSTEGLSPGAWALSCMVKPSFHFEGRRPGCCLNSHLWMDFVYVMDGDHPGTCMGPWGYRPASISPNLAPFSPESSHRFPCISCGQVVSSRLLKSERNFSMTVVLKLHLKENVCPWSPSGVKQRTALWLNIPGK